MTQPGLETDIRKAGIGPATLRHEQLSFFHPTHDGRTSGAPARAPVQKSRGGERTQLRVRTDSAMETTTNEEQFVLQNT
eukprot:527694-Pyramimonas_sp.AAC.1